MDERKLLILDIDETLVFSTYERLPGSYLGSVGPYHVHPRPYLQEFLSVAFSLYQVATWTSSTRSYSDQITPLIFGARARDLRFTWARERCTWRRFVETDKSFYTKNLAKVRRQGFLIRGILAVDNDPEKFFRSYGNYIRVSDFEGDQSDKELFALAAYLEELSEVPNVRTIEKRNWRAAYL